MRITRLKNCIWKLTNVFCCSFFLVSFITKGIFKSKVNDFGKKGISFEVLVRRLSLISGIFCTLESFYKMVKGNKFHVRLNREFLVRLSVRN